jgi:hypothetical protein
MSKDFVQSHTVNVLNDTFLVFWAIDYIHDSCTILKCCVSVCSLKLSKARKAMQLPGLIMTV